MLLRSLRVTGLLLVCLLGENLDHLILDSLDLVLDRSDAAAALQLDHS